MSKFIPKPKVNIDYVPRLSHWVKDRESYFTMERNERVDEFNISTMKILKKISSYDLRTYPDTYYLYKSLANRLKVKENNILVTEGADGSLLRVFNVFVDKGDKVLTLEPGYAMYPVYCKMFKAKYIPIKLTPSNNDDYFLKLKKLIKLHKPKIIAIANPNQPIEVLLNIKQLNEICKLANQYKSIFIVDEAYYHFNKVSAKSLIKNYKNLIVVRTFSKAFGLAGLRVGYTISNEKNIGFLKSIKPIYEINSINIKIILFFLKNLKIMRQYVEDVNISRNILIKFFQKYKIKVYGKFSNTVLIEFSDLNTAKIIAKKLYQKRYIVRFMNFQNKGFIRLTLSGKKIINNCLKEIKKILK